MAWGWGARCEWKVRALLGREGRGSRGRGDSDYVSQVLVLVAVAMANEYLALSCTQ